MVCRSPKRSDVGVCWSPQGPEGRRWGESTAAVEAAGVGGRMGFVGRHRPQHSLRSRGEETVAPRSRGDCGSVLTEDWRLTTVCCPPSAVCCRLDSQSESLQIRYSVRCPSGSSSTPSISSPGGAERATVKQNREPVGNRCSYQRSPPIACVSWRAIGRPRPMP